MKRAARFVNRLNFRVAQRIFVQFTAVSAGRNDFAVFHNRRAHGHFALGGAFFGKRNALPHNFGFVHKCLLVPPARANAQ